MPIRKKDNKKNLAKEERDGKIVPSKEHQGTRKLVVGRTGVKEDVPRVNAAATSGKRKKPKT